ncbi:hypothetical protein [Niallia taxi]|uniref:hypothetical protein n=1 Tax=Niallia taxi TaxID=2499688 RepID=UPI003D26B161
MWYAYLIIEVFLLIFLIMPKKLSLKEIYYSTGVIGFAAWLGDTLVGDVFSLFRIGPSPKTYMIDYIFISFIPLAIGLIYLNFLIIYKSAFYKWLWVVLAFFLEWGAAASGYMVNRGWKTWYSIPVFIMVFFVFLPYHLKILRNEQKNHQH